MGLVSKFYGNPSIFSSDQLNRDGTRRRGKNRKKKKAKRFDRHSGYKCSKVTIYRPSEFYQSDAWMAIRYEALRLHGGKCQCCGRTRQDNVKMHVDHIKPRSKFPELELNINNLQVLCEECNRGKSNRDATDWR